MDQHTPELRAQDPDPKLPVTQYKLSFLIYGKPTLLVSSLINIYLLGIYLMLGTVEGGGDIMEKDINIVTSLTFHASG